MITVKEEFLSSVKTKLAVRLGGSDAVVLWLALKTYASSSNSGGFIPEESVDYIEGVPAKWRSKAMPALLNCGKLRPDGSRGPGLVETATHGYQLHDYEDHGTSVEAEEVRRAKAREQKRKQRRALKMEADKLNLSADCPQDIGTDSPPDAAPDMSADIDQTPGPDCPPDSSRASGRAPTRERARARPSPAHPSQLDLPPSSEGTEERDPDPDQPDKSGSQAGGGRRPSPKHPFPSNFPSAPEFFESTRQRGYPDWWVKNRHEAYCDRAVAKGWKYSNWRRAFLDFLGGEIGYGRGPEQLRHLAPAGTSAANDIELAKRREAAARVEAIARGEAEPGVA